FKTRNTYKRHLQTKHSKILTSKGIIELSSAVPYQSVPRNHTATTTTNSAAGGHQTEPPSSGPNMPMVKPRRKYGLKFLHKNIEAISKYESQQQQLITTTTTTTNTGLGEHHQLVVGSTSAATASTVPGSNITIVNIPPSI